MEQPIYQPGKQMITKVYPANEFKQGNSPAKDVITQMIGRDARPVQKLTPPVFEEDLIDLKNPNIAWGMSLKKAENGRFI